MKITFATCVRKKALEFIQKVYPGREITDTKDSAAYMLDFVDKDLIRIQDPMMYGNRIQVVPGKNWKEDNELRKKILKTCNDFHNKYKSK